jgi:ferrous iron transport protein A
MNSLTTIAALEPGQSGVIASIEAPDDVRMKLYELGLLPGEPVVMRRHAPWGGPVEIEVLHYRLAIRRSEAERILVKPT